jgi:hypothetical protein
VKAEGIIGEKAIREVVQEWRRFVIEQWRHEPLRMIRGIPYTHVLYPYYHFEFEGGWIGSTTVLDKWRFLNSGCVTLAFNLTQNPTKPRTVLYLEPNPGPYAHKIPDIVLFRLEEEKNVLYDPIALLYNLLIRRRSLVPQINEKPLTAAEILELSQKQFVPDQHEGWIRLD